MFTPLPGHWWRAGDVAYRQARVTGSHIPAAVVGSPRAAKRRRDYRSPPQAVAWGGGDQTPQLESQIPHHLCRFRTLHGTKIPICSFCAIHKDAETPTMVIVFYRVHTLGQIH